MNAVFAGTQAVPGCRVSKFSMVKIRSVHLGFMHGKDACVTLFIFVRGTMQW
jgi:hypothetical protein